MDFHSSPFSRVYGTCLICIVYVDGFLLKQRETQEEEEEQPKKKIYLSSISILKKKENCNDQEIFPILGVAINVLILKFG